MYFTPKFREKFFRIGFLFVIVLILLDLLTYFVYPDSKYSPIFLATREQTPLTWVSSTILLLIALSSATAYFNSKKKVWYFVALVFFFLSIDDATYLHERLSGAIQESVPFLANFPSYSWILLYFPILLFGLVSLVYFLWVVATKKEKHFLILSVLFLAFSLVLDMLDGWVSKSNILVFCYESECNSAVEHIFRLTEEFLEVFGLGILAYLNLKKHSTLE